MIRPVLKCILDYFDLFHDFLNRLIVWIELRGTSTSYFTDFRLSFSQTSIKSLSLSLFRVIHIFNQIVHLSVKCQAYFIFSLGYSLLAIVFHIGLSFMDLLDSYIDSGIYLIYSRLHQLIIVLKSLLIYLIELEKLRINFINFPWYHILK